jgi:hypothetical protein
MGWSQKNLDASIGFATSDNVKRTWAQITIVKSTTSKGSIDADFASEWDEFAVKLYNASNKPIALENESMNGWQVRSGTGKFVFNNENAAISVTTFSNGQRCISFTITTNSDIYESILDAFGASISIRATEATSINKAPVVSAPASAKDQFQFGTTNFDDGWTSTVQEDWVEAHKGNIKVLLHYPRKEDAEYISQQVEQTRLFWNLLVAPRYASATDFFLYEYNNSYDPAHFASATLTDHSGKKQFVALFMKSKSGWIEVITPDKQTFINAFGVDRPDSYYDGWQALFNLSGLNRFAVGENDLTGKWSSDFSGSMQYYSAFTGTYTGYNAYASRETFTFRSNKSYDWKLSTANSSNGQTVAQNTESSGTFSMKGNWQVICSKIQDGPRTYNTYFSCIKGGRILWLQDVSYGNYTAYGKSAQ